MKYIPIVLIAGLVLSLCSNVASASPLAGSVNLSFSTSFGLSGTSTIVGSHSAGKETHSGTADWTNALGGTGTHTWTNSYDPYTGIGTHQAATTYANGTSTSSLGTLTRTSPGNFSYTGTVTRANGNVLTVNRTSVQSATGRSVSSTVYDPVTNETATKNVSYTLTSDGYTDSATFTGPKGNTGGAAQTVTFTTANGTTTRHATTTLTGPNGGTYTFSTSVSYSASTSSVNPK